MNVTRVKVTSQKNQRTGTTTVCITVDIFSGQSVSDPLCCVISSLHANFGLMSLICEESSL